jgi:hypothetical protein
VETDYGDENKAWRLSLSLRSRVAMSDAVIYANPDMEGKS